MGIEIETQDDRTLLVLESAIDIGSAAELKAHLLLALESARPVEVSMAAATYLDVTAVQLLWAAQRQARLSNVAFELVEMPPGLAMQMAEAGFQWFQAAGRL